MAKRLNRAAFGGDRDLNRTDNVKSARCTDALLNYETVLYFSNQDLEVKRYGDAVGDYQVPSDHWRLEVTTSVQAILTLNSCKAVSVGMPWLQLITEHASSLLKVFLCFLAGLLGYRASCLSKER